MIIMIGNLRKGVFSKIKNKSGRVFAFFFFSIRPVGRNSVVIETSKK